MKCFECGGEVLKTLGTVRMTRSDGSLIIFRANGLKKMGELMRQKETLVFEEMLSVLIINLCRQTIGGGKRGGQAGDDWMKPFGLGGSLCEGWIPFGMDELDG